ncbi:hypothetical protein L207DRAFT_294053 [Hyaloscypha variabilis F]|jgi:hypothetical protein|uniref:Uncharacterized protein n=1 Tax=Hyaloscypha variabilis (strain UAMH 11265 / GT02V1 / F) TaxID=1149755 RepID=A0A2J6RXW2_HYAVF|nr:hypothetical protein L207DRAFT_294053 [Hyaloscypha variabilis F]
MASAVAEESMANWLRVNRQRHTELARANLNFSMRTLKPIIVSWRLTHECAVCPAQLLRGSHPWSFPLVMLASRMNFSLKP